MERNEDISSEEKSPVPTVGLFTKYSSGAGCWKSVADRPHPALLMESGALKTCATQNCSYVLHNDVLHNKQISVAQLEAIAFCCDQHNKFFGKFRCGYFIGEGAGVGKTRIIIGIILENLALGRGKVLWITVNPTLVKDAVTELRRLGYGGKIFTDVHAAKNDGVVLLTYKNFKPQGSSSLKRWLDPAKDEKFDGLIVFDECHKAKSEKSANGKNVNFIQDSYPRARVVYVSATAASDISAMHYMSRLALWGLEFPAKHFDAFKVMVGKGNLDLMEVLAMELRHNGQYIARTISFTDCHFSIDYMSLRDQQTQLYDECCAFWQKLRVHGKSMDNKRKNFWSLFYSHQQRFFHALLCAFKSDGLDKHILECVGSGASVVVGIQTTGETAGLDCNRRKTENESSDEKAAAGPRPKKAKLVTEDDLDVSLCREILFKVARTLLLNESSIVDGIGKLTLPENVIDKLSAELEDKGLVVSQLTGRSKRFSKGRLVVCPKLQDEMDNFQSGLSKVVIISDAASTGISLHCSHHPDVRNKDRRHHILLEFPWSAEKALQQLGRTNRANQVHPPVYLIMTTDLPGELRFSCAVAARVKSLGATTYANRSLMNHLNLQEFDYFNEYGDAALRITFEKVRQDPVLMQALVDVDLSVTKKESLERVFNRLLAVQVKHQKKFSDIFKTSFGEVLSEAKLQLSFSIGVKVLDYGEVMITAQQPFAFNYGPLTKKINVVRFKRFTGIAFKELSLKMDAYKGVFSGFYIEISPPKVGRPNIIAQIKTSLYRPNGNQMTVTSVPSNKVWQKIPTIHAERIWEAQRRYFQQYCYHRYRKGSCAIVNCEAGMGISRHALFCGSIFTLAAYILEGKARNVVIGECKSNGVAYGGLEVDKRAEKKMLSKLEAVQH